MKTPPEHYDEMQQNDGVRAPYTVYDDWFQAQDKGWLKKKGREAEAFFRKTGITFNV